MKKTKALTSHTFRGCTNVREKPSGFNFWASAGSEFKSYSRLKISMALIFPEIESHTYNRSWKTRFFEVLSIAAFTFGLGSFRCFQRRVLSYAKKTKFHRCNPYKNCFEFRMVTKNWQEIEISRLNNSLAISRQKISDSTKKQGFSGWKACEIRKRKVLSSSSRHKTDVFRFWKSFLMCSKSLQLQIVVTFERAELFWWFWHQLVSKDRLSTLYRAWFIFSELGEEPKSKSVV